MNSLRRQLLWRVSAGLCLVLGVSGALLYFYLQHVLVSAFDAGLRDKAQVFARTTEMHGNGSLDLEFTESELPEFSGEKNTGYFEVWDLGGAVAARSPSLG